jgi:antidote-toxin recognition MazE-like antitoxin
MPKSIADRVEKRRAALRKAGLRPIQIWAPDTRGAGFAAECRRQSELAAQADRNDPELSEFLDAALADIFGHSDSP